ncbi:MAG: AbiV family abortive infection protein, partial [Candidatus Heimdallarchaeaceae archaeon]
MSEINSNIEKKLDKYDFYLKLMEVTLDNADQYRKDALLLREKLSFGHAYSLAILGFEELAKVWFAFGLFIGEFRETDDIASDITSDHLTKQEIGWQILSIAIMSEWLEQSKFMPKIQDLIQELVKGKISIQAYTKKFYNFAEIEGSSLEIARKVVELKEVLQK